MNSREVKQYPSKISDFVWVKDNVLTSDFCKHCIERFNRDQNMSDGMTGGGLRKEIKDTMDLMVSRDKNWSEEDGVFKETLNENLFKYFEYLDTFAPCFELKGHHFYDTGYQIQRYEPGSGYTWHHDDNLPQNLEQRSMTFIWYLNTVKKDGYTEFVDGTRVRAKEGRLVIFPSGWTFLHRGYPPKDQRKYICTGWLHAHAVDE